LRQDDALLCEDRQIWIKSLRAYSHRLRWHCQFIQKLEDQPTIEHQNVHSAYDGLRLLPNNKLAAQRLVAWETGQTGYPLIDAGMRALIATGWLNFRLRALLISFAGYQLWLDWQAPALHLARLFTDYEPGVHYNQIQMQIGTTGLTTLRIDDPTEKSQILDDEGIFIRQWVPELANIPDDMIHTPWLMNEPPENYPGPIVPERETRQNAYEKIRQLRNTPSYIAEKASLLDNPGSFFQEKLSNDSEHNTHFDSD
jgi:deoxyribodipyrimidine photo-lyase